MTSVARRRLVKETMAAADEANQLTDVEKQIQKVEDLLHKFRIQKSLLTPSSIKKTSHVAAEETSEEDLADQQDSQELF